MATIFISYSRESHEKARSIAEDLEALGYQAWFDRALTGGQAWWNLILAEIQRCDIFAFALEPDSLDSAACKREYAYAHNLGKTILPILIADGVAEDLLPSALAQIQYVDYRKEDKVSFRALAKALSGLPPSAPLPDPLPEPPPAPVSYLGGLKEQVEAQEGLSFAEQTQLVIRLKTGLRNAKDADQVRDLLRLFRSRDDLYAKVADEIDALLSDALAANSVTLDSPLDSRTVEPSRPTADIPVAVNETVTDVASTADEHTLPSASSFELFWFQHFWFSVFGGLLIAGAIDVGLYIDPTRLWWRASWSIPAALIFNIVVVWKRASFKPIYFIVFLFIPISAALLIPVRWYIYHGSDPMFGREAIWEFRLLMAFIPTALLMPVFARTKTSMVFASLALGSGLLISVVFSQISSLMWDKILFLVNWVLAAGFVVYLLIISIVWLVRRRRVTHESLSVGR